MGHPHSTDLDGIARHRRAHSVNAEGISRAARIVRELGGGVSASAAFHRDPAYRRQLGELLSLAAEARARIAL